MCAFAIILSMENAQDSDLKKLQFENSELRAELAQRDQVIAGLNQKLTVLEEQLDWFKRQIFGKKSERITGNIGNAQQEFPGFDVPKSPEEEKPLPPATC
jgi:archaellum component FlaC